MNTTDSELWKSQWTPLAKIVGLTDEALNVSNDEAMRALKLRGLAAVRPALLTITHSPTVLTTRDDRYAHDCIEAALTPHADWGPSDTDDPSTAVVEFHKVAFIEWVRGTDLPVDVTDLKSWKSDLYLELKRRKLLVVPPTRETLPDSSQAAIKTYGKHIQLCDAPSCLGISRKLFDREVRPYVTAIEYPNIRGIWFDKEDLNARADAIKQQYGRPGETDNQCPQPKHRKDSSYAATLGISTRLSQDDEFEKARARLPRK